MVCRWMGQKHTGMGSPGSCSNPSADLVLRYASRVLLPDVPGGPQHLHLVLLIMFSTFSAIFAFSLPCRAGASHFPPLPCWAFSSPLFARSLGKHGALCFPEFA